MDFRQWIQAVANSDHLEPHEGADADIEIGTIADMMQDRMEGPALLFDQISGDPPGYRILTNTMTSSKRLALTLRLARLL